jgi:hypothetical protein
VAEVNQISGRRIWQAIFLILFLCSLAVFSWVHSVYTANLPHQPDVANGRTIPLEAKGGIIYGNSKEACWWNWSRNAFIACVAIVLLAAMSTQQKKINSN